MREIVSIFFIIFFLNQIAYAKECPDKEYIRYKQLSFVHKGFVSPYLIDAKTKKGMCDLRAETYLYNKSLDNSKAILVGDSVVGIKEYGGGIIAIFSTLGSHGGEVLFLKQEIVDKDQYPNKFKLIPIKIENEGDAFYSNMGNSISVLVSYQLTKRYPTLEVVTYNIQNRTKLVTKRYKLSYEKMKFFLEDLNK